MSKYIKSYSNFVLKKQHQLINDGKIYERDITTIGGTNHYSAGQIPLYADSNFKITVRGGLFGKKKHNFGKWIKNCSETSDEWTIDNLITCGVNENINSNDVDLNQVSDNILDFAYYGSSNELIRASIENIIRNFPSELYFGQRKQEYVKSNGELDFIKGSIIENPFEIDLFSQSINKQDVDNVLRYFSASYMNYNVMIGSNVMAITSFSSIPVSGLNINCLQDGQVMKNITIGYNGGTLKFTLNYCNGRRILIYDNVNYSNIHIRPNSIETELFFEKLDGFEKLLLNRKSNPLYKSKWITPINTPNGITFVKRPYVFPIQNGWNLDISDFPYASYIEELTQMGTLYDELFSDNLYRSMTHEAIKNFDWTYTREYEEGEEVEYVIGGTKISNLLHIYGRTLDDLKRYIDGIKFTNTITYNNFNNIPNSLLSDKIELDGWVITTTIPTGKELTQTDGLYPGENNGYSFIDANNIFLKNLAINSKALWRAKGTKRSIEMIIGLFGIKRNWYELKEYVYTVSPKTDNIENIININKNKNIEHNDYYDLFDGLLVKEFYELDNNNNKIDRKLYPWYTNGKVYDGNVTFQSAGGWGKSITNGYTTYRETNNYTNVVETLDELITLPVKSVQTNDVYYVMIADGFSSKYFRLINKENLRTIGNNGWKNISETDSEVQYLKSIVDTTIGNNPHVGFGKYDGGEEYLSYLKQIFKYAINNNKLSATDLATAKSIGGFTLNGPFEDNKKCWSTFKTTNNNTNIFKNSRIYNATNRQTNYSISNSNDTVNIKKFVIKNSIGGANFSNYFLNHILPYIEQVLPSTVLYELEGFQSGGSSKSISLSKNEISLNNDITEDTTTLFASDDWKMVDTSTIANISPTSGIKTSGTKLNVKKKNSYGVNNVKFVLTSDSTISTFLIIRNSMINITPKVWNIPNNGGNMTFNIVVDGHDALSNEYTYISTNPNIIITKNGSLLIAKAIQNNSTDIINGNILVTHAYDSSCVDSASIIQEASDMSIQVTPNQYKFDVDGGEYTFNVSVIGGSEDFIYNLPNNKWISVINKTKNSITVKALPNFGLIDSTPVTILFGHLDNSALTSSVQLTQPANSALSIAISPNSITLEPEINNKPNVAHITVMGGSKAFKIDYNSIPSWLTIVVLDYSLTVISTQNNDPTNRTFSLKVEHLDNSAITATLNITQKSFGELKIEANPLVYEFPFYKSLNNFNIKVYGGSKNFTFTSNGDWFNIVKTTGEDLNSYQNYVLKVTSTENKSFTDKKNGIITVYHSDNNTILTKIVLTQDVQTKFSINAENSSGAIITEIAGIECSGYTSGDKYKIKVVVKPDGTDYAITSIPNWVTYNKFGTINTDKYLQLFFAPNTFTIDRSENIILTHTSDPSITKKIKLTQLTCGVLSVLINSKTLETWSIEPIGGTQTFAITVTGGNKKYIVNNTANWVSSNITGTSDAPNIILTVDKIPQLSLGNRSTIITLTHIDDKSVIATLEVTQKEGLSISKEPNDDMLNIVPGGTSKSYNIIPRGGTGQCVVLSTQPSWVSVVKNGNKLNITVRVNAESTERTHTITVAHADDNSLTVTIKILQQGFKLSVDIQTPEPKQWIDICPFKPDENCGCNCDNTCNEKELPANRGQEKDYDVIAIGGSGKWILPTDLNESEWCHSFQEGEKMVIQVDENIDELNDREKIITTQHRDGKDVIDTLKVKQKKAIKTYKNYKIQVEPNAIRIPARGENVVGVGMTAEYYLTESVKVTSTKEKFINCRFNKLVYVPWNATTDCKDSLVNLPCELRVNGNVVKGKLTKLKYNEISEDGGNGSVSIFSTKNWTAKITAGSEWITLSTNSGNGGVTSNISFTIRKNETCLERTGAIIIDSCDGKQINIEIYQKKGHICTLSVIPVHPIPSVIPKEGGIYMYRVSSYDCNVPVAWEVEASNCTVNCVAGYNGGTESVGCTIKIEKSEGETQKEVSVTFKQKGNSKCKLQTSSISGSQEPEPPKPGIPCFQLFTPNGVDNTPSSGFTSTWYVVINCENDVPLPWTISIAAPGKIVDGTTSGVGPCCSSFDATDYPNYGGCVASAPSFRVEIPPNTGTTSRDIVLTVVGAGCGSDGRYAIHQLGTEECTDGNYVAWKDARTISDYPQTGGTLNELISRYCDTSVISYTVNGADNVSVTPTGKINSAKIDVGANDTTSDRTITITINPNIDTKALNMALPTFSYSDDNRIIINGEVYSDYTDDIQNIDNSTFNESSVYTPSNVKRVKYTPDSTNIISLDKFGDATNSVESEKVELTLGENREPVERSCKVYFEQKENDETGKKQKTELTIWQDAAIVELRDNKFIVCPGSLTANADGGILVASVQSTADKYINGIKREEFIPVNYSVACTSEKWLSIDSNNIINVQANDDYVNDRLATFTFVQDNSFTVQNLVLFQKRKDKDFTYNILTDHLHIRFDLTGGTKTLTVTSIMMPIINGIEQHSEKIGYTVVGTDTWCTIDTKTNVITCLKNEDGLNARAMSFIFTQDKSGINHTVLVEQSEMFKYVLEAKPNSLTFSADGGNEVIDIKSQLIPIVDKKEKDPRDLKYKISGGTDWCKVNETSKTITCSPNEDKENARVTSFNITQEKTGLISSVLVFQKKPDILPELYEYIDKADALLQTNIDNGDANLQAQIDSLSARIDAIPTD